MSDYSVRIGRPHKQPARDYHELAHREVAGRDRAWRRGHTIHVIGSGYVEARITTLPGPGDGRLLAAYAYCGRTIMTYEAAEAAAITLGWRQ